jgi:hypothetical protein
VIRLRGTVTYHDGRVEDFDVGTRALVVWEAYARRNAIAADPKNPTRDFWTMMFVVAHYALAGQEQGFEAWLATVDDLDPATDEADVVVPPTLQEALAG